MKKITIIVVLIFVAAITAAVYVYFFKTYEDSQINTVNLYKNDIENKAMKDITNSFDEENQQIQEQLNQ